MPTLIMPGLYTDTQYKKFVGQGITFPIVLNNGRAQVFTGVELIRSSIKIILSWETGNRFFLAEFASRLESLLFEPNDFLLKALLQRFVIEALDNWEARIELLQSSVEKVNNEKVSITMTYRILTTNTVDTFTFPFYDKIIY